MLVRTASLTLHANSCLMKAILMGNALVDYHNKYRLLILMGWTRTIPLSQDISLPPRCGCSCIYTEMCSTCCLNSPKLMGQMQGQHLYTRPKATLCSICRCTAGHRPVTARGLNIPLKGCPGNTSSSSAGITAVLETLAAK